MNLSNWNKLMTDLLAQPYFKEGVQALIAMLLIFTLVHFAHAFAARKIDDKDLRYKTRKAFSMVGYVLTLLAVVLIFSDQLSNLAFIVGALSVGIGFALRELIQSLIGWGIISFGSMYKPGERIQVGSIMGDVIDIGPLTTTVMECGGWVKADLYNGRLVRLSNSLVFKEHIINYTSDFPFLWDEIVIPVRTDSDHRLARSIIEKTAETELSKISGESKAVWRNFVREYRIEDAKLDPMISMSFDANWIEFTLRYVVDYRARRATKDRLFTSILAGIEATQGKVEIASASMQLTEIPALHLHSKTDFLPAAR